MTKKHFGSDQDMLRHFLAKLMTVPSIPLGCRSVLIYGKAWQNSDAFLVPRLRNCMLRDRSCSGSREDIE
jgi:hypothetical protein